MQASDKSTMIADLNDLGDALDMKDRESEIVGFTKDMVYADRAMVKAAREFNRKYSYKDDEFSPVMVSLGEQGGLKDILQTANAIGRIIVMVFVFAMSIVLQGCSEEIIPSGVVPL
jgi:hypothetical protein